MDEECNEVLPENIEDFARGERRIDSRKVVFTEHQLLRGVENFLRDEQRMHRFVNWLEIVRPSSRNPWENPLISTSLTLATRFISAFVELRSAPTFREQEYVFYSIVENCFEQFVSYVSSHDSSSDDARLKELLRNYPNTIEKLVPLVCGFGKDSSSDGRLCVRLLGVLCEIGSFKNIVMALTDFRSRWTSPATLVLALDEFASSLTWDPSWRRDCFKKVVEAIKFVIARAPAWWRYQLQLEACTWQPATWTSTDLQAAITSLIFPGDSIRQIPSIDYRTLEPIPQFMGMPLGEPVHVVESSRIRFRFVFDKGRVGPDKYFGKENRSERSVRDWLKRSRILSFSDMENILRDEDLCDAIEHETSKSIEEALSELGTSRLDPLVNDYINALINFVWNAELDDQSSNERLDYRPSILAKDLPFDEQVAEILRRLEAKILDFCSSKRRGPSSTDSTEGSFPESRRRLREISRTFLESVLLTEDSRGVLPFEFPSLQIEGALGEYYWRSRTVVVYPRMIELVSRDLARSSERPLAEAESLVSSAVLAHEAIHAVCHVGLDSFGEIWKTPTDGTIRFHESLTQGLTRCWILQFLNLSNRRILEEFESRLPEDYSFGHLLPGQPTHCNLEAIRRYLLNRRQFGNLPDPYSMGVKVLNHARTVIDQADLSVEAKETSGLANNVELLRYVLQTVAYVPAIWREIVLNDPTLFRFLSSLDYQECCVFWDVVNCGNRSSSSLSSFLGKDVPANQDTARDQADRKSEENHFLEESKLLKMLIAVTRGDKPITDSPAVRLLQDRERSSYRKDGQ